MCNDHVIVKLHVSFDTNTFINAQLPSSLRRECHHRSPNCVCLRSGADKIIRPLFTLRDSVPFLFLFTLWRKWNLPLSAWTGRHIKADIRISLIQMLVNKQTISIFLFPKKSSFLSLGRRRKGFVRFRRSWRRGRHRWRRGIQTASRLSRR